MSSIDSIIQRLPDLYRKDPDSNNYKTLQLNALQLDAIRDVLAEIKAAHFVDDAFGQSLDNIGENIGRPRITYPSGIETDTAYRARLKASVSSIIGGGTKDSIATALGLILVIPKEDIIVIDGNWVGLNLGIYEVGVGFIDGPSVPSGFIRPIEAQVLEVPNVNMGLSIEYTNQDSITGRTATTVILSAASLYDKVAVTLEGGDTGVIDITNISLTTGPSSGKAIINYDDITFERITNQAHISIVGIEGAGDIIWNILQNTLNNTKAAGVAVERLGVVFPEEVFVDADFHVWPFGWYRSTILVQDSPLGGYTAGIAKWTIDRKKIDDLQAAFTSANPMVARTEITKTDEKNPTFAGYPNDFVLYYDFWEGGGQYIHNQKNYNKHVGTLSSPVWANTPIMLNKLGLSGSFLINEGGKTYNLSAIDPYMELSNVGLTVENGGPGSLDQKKLDYHNSNEERISIHDDALFSSVSALRPAVPFSIVAWGRANDITDLEAWVFGLGEEVGGASSPSFFVGSNSLGKGEMGIVDKDLTTYYRTSGVDVLDGDWHQYVITCYEEPTDTWNWELYIDNQKIGTTVQTSYLENWYNVPFAIGASSGGTDSFWDDFIGSFSYYERVLESWEIRRLYLRRKSLFMDLPTLNFGNTPFYVSLTGSDDINVPHDAELEPSTDLTVIFWMKAEPADIDVFDKISGNTGWQIKVKSDGALEINYGNGSTVTGTSVPSVDVNDGQWHHVAVVYEFSLNQARLYKNGVAIAVPGSYTSYSGSTADLSIGNGDVSLMGVAIYQRALTPTEIADSVSFIR